jgi:hypothetical protein
MIELQQSANSLTADDGVFPPRLNAARKNQHVAQALVVPLKVVVRRELANGPS